MGRKNKRWIYFGLIFSFLVTLCVWLIAMQMIYWLFHPFVWFGTLFLVFLIYFIYHSKFWMNIVINHFGAILLSMTFISISIMIAVTNYNFVNVTQNCCHDCAEKEEVIMPNTGTSQPTLYSWQTMNTSPVPSRNAPTGCRNLGTTPEAAIGNTCTANHRKCSASDGTGGLMLPVIECQPRTQHGNWHNTNRPSRNVIVPACPGHLRGISPDGVLCYAKNEECSFGGNLYTCQ